MEFNVDTLLTGVNEIKDILTNIETNMLFQNKDVILEVTLYNDLVTKSNDLLDLVLAMTSTDDSA